MLHEQIYALELIAARSHTRSCGPPASSTSPPSASCGPRSPRAARRAPSVVVDLREVTFMDTFALRALLALQEERR